MPPPSSSSSSPAGAGGGRGGPITAPPSSSAAVEAEGLGLLGFWGLRRVEEWAAEEAAELGRAGALPKESGKKARIASSSISPPSAMGTHSPPARSGWVLSRARFPEWVRSGASAGSREGAGPSVSFRNRSNRSVPVSRKAGSSDSGCACSLDF